MVGELNFSSPNYPKQLKLIDRPPENLYYQGNLSDNFDNNIFDDCLAVVGSRKMTPYGKRTTERLVYQLASDGITIVSGFMYGIDISAHKASLAAGGKTIAVVAFGIEREPPAYLKSTYLEIIENGGLIVSELSGEEPPKKWSFPKRNRIIAGLSKAVLVVEAAKNSGSLITAEYALKFKRHIFAVPGPIDSDKSQGTLELIKNGHQIVTGINEISQFFGRSRKTAHPGKVMESRVEGEGNETSLENEIMALARKRPLSLGEISSQTREPISLINQSLTRLILLGHLTEEAGKFYASYS